MNIFMIGEAATHAATLAAGLSEGCAIVPLPREAAFAPDFDGGIGAEDVVISLRFRRAPGAAPAVRLLHVPGAGLDGIDLAGLAPATTVCNVFEHEIPIAEYVLSAMLEREIGAAAMRRSFTPEGWSDVYRNRVPHGEIHGKTLGLIGFGRIGRAIAARARPFGMRVVAMDTRAAPDAAADAVLAPERLGAMLAEADYVVVACPLTPRTRGLIGAAELAAMKPEAVLINVSRAEIVDEGALYAALSEGRIGGACLDVWYRYPLGADDHLAPADHPFHTLPNVVCTPHSSAWTRNLPQRRYARIADNIERLRRGEPLTNVVRAAAPAARREPT